MTVELVTTKKRMLKLGAKPTFKTFKIFNEDLVAVEMGKLKLLLNRPIYVGFSILDLSKVLMYNFYYNVLKSKYGDRMKLLFTDTDSLCVHIHTQDVYQDMMEQSDLYDFSGYPTDHLCYNQENKKKIGVFKDECDGIPPSSYVGLRPKMYSLSYGGITKTAAKGVKKYIIKRHLKHESFKQCLTSQNIQQHSMNMIRSDHHKLYTINQTKITLSPFDDKRYLLSDGISSLAYGHYKINSGETDELLSPRQ